MYGRKNVGCSVSRGFFPIRGPYVNATFEDESADMAYGEIMIPIQGDASGAFWSPLMFYAGPYVFRFQLDHSVLREENVYSFCVTLHSLSHSKVAPVSSDFVGRNCRVKINGHRTFIGSDSEPVSWEPNARYGLCARLWHNHNVSSTSMGFFVYSYKTGNWSTCAILRIPSAKLLITGCRVVSTITRVYGCAVGYSAFVGQHFRMLNGHWIRPIYYTAWAEGKHHSWDAQLSIRDVYLMAGGQFGNVENPKYLPVEYKNNSPLSVHQPKLLACEIDYDIEGHAVILLWKLDKRSPPQLGYNVVVELPEPLDMVLHSAGEDPHLRSLRVQLPITAMECEYATVTLTVSSIFLATADCAVDLVEIAGKIRSAKCRAQYSEDDDDTNREDASATHQEVSIDGVKKKSSKKLSVNKARNATRKP